MSKELRRLGKADTEAMFKLVCYAFNKEQTVERREHFSRLVDHSWNYGLYLEDKLASQVMCTPFDVNFHGSSYKMGGIGYVASYPEYRGQGGIKETMRQIISDMKENELALSYLAPFSYGFYRQFGYEAVFENLSYRLQRGNLPKGKKVPGKVTRIKLKEVGNYLKELYEKNPQNKRGGLSRSDWWWHYLLFKNKDHNYAVYFDEDENPQGYLIYERKEATFKIVEWNYLTANAFHALGNFILSHESAFEEFVYEAPNSEHSLSYLLSEPNIEVKVVPYMMARIVDLKLFLEKYPYLKTGVSRQFTFGVTDEYAPWNQGIWQLEVSENGQAKITKLTDNPQDAQFLTPDTLKGPIQEWTQLLMGYRRPKDLAFYERLTGSLTQFDLLEELIPRGLPTLLDYF